MQKKFRQALRISFKEGLFRALGVVLGILFLVFYLRPLLVLVLKSVGISLSGVDPSLQAYVRVFSDGKTWEAFANSVRTGLQVSLATTLIAGIMSWLVVKTDFPCKRVVSGLSLLTFIIPSYILGIAWLQIFGRNGYLARIVEQAGLGGYSFRYYSAEAVSVVMTIHLYPLVFMAFRNALENHDRTLEQAAVLSGASSLKTAITVTLPLIVPTILSVGLLTFSRSVANFDIPALLALPVRKEFLTTRIYVSLNNLDLTSASALSILLILLSVSFYIATSFFTADKRFALRNAKKDLSPSYKLGKSKPLVVALVFLFQGLTGVIPLLTLLVSSFLKRWGLPLERQYLTCGNYVQLLFHNPQAITAFKNSLLYGIAGASLAAVVSGCLILSKTDTRMRRFLEIILSWPIAAPNIVLAIGAILCWNAPPLKLYGTPWVIIVTYMTLFIPIMLKNISGLIAGQDAHQVLAGRLSGASQAKSSIDIVLPAIYPGLKAGWLFCFLIALREIPISLLLYSSGQTTIGVLLFGMQSQSYGLEMTSTLAIVIIAILAAGNLILRTVRRGLRNVEIGD